MNKFIFDYNVVLALDPSYEKYLYDGSKGSEPTNNPFTPVQETDVPAVHQALMQQGHNPWRRNGLDSDELDIVNMINGENKISRNRVDDPRVNTIELSDMISTDKPNWVLKYEYQNQSLNGAKMNPLQLLPPKTVLHMGSSIERTPQTQYTVNVEDHKGLAKTLSRSRFTDASDSGKLRLIHSSYWFDPIHNVMSEKKNTFRSIVYNTDTHCLYVRTFTGNGQSKGPKKRYKSTVRGVAFNVITLSIIYNAMPVNIFIQFVERLMEIVLKDVPNAYIPYNGYVDQVRRDGNKADIPKLVYLTSILVLQHKYGQRIDWFDRETFCKVSPLLNDQNVLNYFTNYDGWMNGEITHKCLNYRKSRLAAIRKCLKQKPGLKSFARAMFGKQYSKFAFTMFLHKIEPDNLSRLLAAANDGRMPKNIYHYIVRLLKGDLKEDAAATLSTIANSVMNEQGMPGTKQRLYTCLTTYERLGTTPGHRGWDRWKDMYNIAERLHVRIRPNKFISIDAVDALHDALSGIYNRDSRIIRSYEGVEFHSFAHPDKEYGDGFKFVFLNTPADLVHEGTTMHHCVGSYSDRCIDGNSIIFSMRKGDRGYITIELDGDTYSIRQQYTIKDNTVENQDILNIIGEWQVDVLDMHKDDKTSYSSICQQIITDQEKAHQEKGRRDLIESGVISQGVIDTPIAAPVPDPVNNTLHEQVEDILDFIRGADVAEAV